MGSSSSHMVSSKSSSSRKLSGSVGSRLNRTKLKLSSLFCGAFTPKSTFKLEDCPEKSTINCTKNLAQISDVSENSIVESSSVFRSEVGNRSSMDEIVDSFGRNSSIMEDTSVEYGVLNVQTSRDQIDLSNAEEPLLHQPAQELVSGNATICIPAAVATHNAITEGTTFICPGHDMSSIQAQGITIPRTGSGHLDYRQDAVVDHNFSDLRSPSIGSDSLPRFELPGDDHAHETTTSSLGFLVFDSDQDLRNRNLLHVNVLSISSNFLSSGIDEINSPESRRNSIRLFWDALSRHSFRRHRDFPTIVFGTGLADDVESQDRWLLDFSSNLHYNGAGRNLDSLVARRHRRNEQGWLFRSEISERVMGGLNEGSRQTTFCASGLHLEGTCSCGSNFTAEESSTLASISRIIMLADALFEVLDEIHRQSLSVSLSTLSLPAPESIVDAFPLKYHKKIKNVQSDPSDIQQCYICLADYEEGEKLRVLPCNHEFHVPCIDKWLKEVNRVCPICRHDVCERAGDCSTSNTEVSSL